MPSLDDLLHLVFSGGYRYQRFDILCSILEAGYPVDFFVAILVIQKRKENIMTLLITSASLCHNKGTMNTLQFYPSHRALLPVTTVQAGKEYNKHSLY